jgi:hypothetical protein
MNGLIGSFTAWAADGARHITGGSTLSRIVVANAHHLPRAPPRHVHEGLPFSASAICSVPLRPRDCRPVNRHR